MVAVARVVGEAKRVVLVVRERQDGDLDSCVALLRASHERDGYPARFPDDPRTWLWSSDAIAGWVAQRDGAIVGHVALHHSSSQPVMDLASQTTGEDTDNFAVVARLVVSETARRAGIGRRLLTTAAYHARARGLVPMLDVNAAQTAAIRLYEGSGWTCLGQVTVTFRNGLSLDEFVYLAPA